MKKEIIICDECVINRVDVDRADGSHPIYDGARKGYSGKITVMLNTNEPYEDYENHFCCRKHLVSWLIQKSMNDRYGIVVEIKEHSIQQERVKFNEQLKEN